MSFLEKGFSPLEVTVNFSWALPLPEKNKLCASYVGSTFWGEIEIK